MIRRRIILFRVPGILTFFWLSRHLDQSKNNVFVRGRTRKGAREALEHLSGARWKVFKGGASHPFPSGNKKTIAWLALWLCNNASWCRYVFAMPKQHIMWYEHVLCNAVQNSRTACIYRRSIHALRQCLHFTNKCKTMKRYIHADGLRMYCSANTHKSKRGMHLGS